jgi:hypothetical protein
MTTVKIFKVLNISLIPWEAKNFPVPRRMDLRPGNFFKMMAKDYKGGKAPE